jgi:hypothetical protein
MPLFSESLQKETRAYFRNEHDVDITNEEADAYLNQLASLFLSINESDTPEKPDRACQMDNQPESRE